MEASVYLTLEKMCKSRKVGYGSSDISALIFDKCGGLKLIDNYSYAKDIGTEFYLIAAHFLRECVAFDKQCPLEEVTTREIATLFSLGKGKMFDVKNNLATDLGVKNCAKEFNQLKFKLITEATGGIKTSERQFNETHRAPAFSQTDVLTSNDLERVFAIKGHKK